MKLKFDFINYVRFKKVLIICIVFLILSACVIAFLPASFAVLQPAKSVEISSEKLDYISGEEGAWQIVQSAKWINSNEVEVALEVDSIKKESNKATDLLIVLDTSYSMSHERLYQTVFSLTEFFKKFLADNNRIGLITFNTSSEIVSDFTSSESLLLQKINFLEAKGNTSYYQALVNVDKVLGNYNYDGGRKCTVLFLTDGYPNVDTPNEVGQFAYLKSKYPFLTVNAVQFYMGTKIAEQIKNISDVQYLVDSEISFDSILNEISNPGSKYDNFEITQYINSDYFYIDSENKIEVSLGKIDFDKKNQKINWLIDNYVSGAKEQLKVRVKLKNGSENKVYSVVNNLKIKSILGTYEESVDSMATPIISSEYDVTYDGNFPSGCSNNGTPDIKRYSVFDVVEVSKNTLTCSGYQFKGWKIVTNDVERVNSDYFTMPESNVELKGVWAKVGIQKMMNGTIGQKHTLYKQVEQDVNDSSKYAKKYMGDTSTFNGKENVYYYYGKAANNNVIFANYCWKIVRTTDTGGVKLLYNGVLSSSGTCNNANDASQLTAAQMGLTTNTITFNTSANTMSGVGYMYNTQYERLYKSTTSAGTALYGNGFTYANGIYRLTNTKSAAIVSDYPKLSNNHYTCWNTTGTCSTVSYVYFSDSSYVYYINLHGGESVFNALDKMLYSNDVNKYSSNIKLAIDYWYSKNMTKYTSYLEDTVWCNDRSINNSEENGWNPNGGSLSTYLLFKSYENLSNLVCPNNNDKFTVNSSNGNGALNYPVGLLTGQEISLAYVSNNSPLAAGGKFWGISPTYFARNDAINLWGTTLGDVNFYRVDLEAGVRPSVSLNSSVEYSSGDGSVNSPYVILND